MRFLAYGPVLLLAMATAGNSASPLAMPSEVLQGTALAVLGWTIWAHMKAIGSQRKDFLAALKEERESHNE